MKFTQSSHFFRRSASSRGNRRHILATSAAILIGWFTPPLPVAHAATVTWQGDLSASWGAGISGTDTTWTGNTLPVTGDSLVFELTTVGVANLSTTNDITGLVLGGANAITFNNDTGAGTGFTLAGNDVTLGGNITTSGATGSHTHTISLGLILNGNRTVTTVGGTTIQIDGIVSETGGARNFIKTGAGTVTLSAANTFTGAISVNQGTLSVNSIAASGTASALGAGSAINLGNAAQVGTLLYTGTGGSTNRSVNLASTGAGGGIITNNGGGAIVFSGAFSNAGAAAKTFTLSGSNTGANDFQSALTDSTGGALSVVKTGGGTWSLSGTSSFSGALSVSQGVLTINSIANSGTNSAAGAGSVINIGSATTTAGTLTYTGTGASTNRTVNLAATTTGGATINSSGTGALIFTGTFANAGSGAKLLTLGGTNASANEIQSVIANGSGTLSVTKADAGSWILSAANTYSGTTTLSAGTLVLNNAGSGGTSSAIGTGGFTFAGGTVDNTSSAPITLSTNNAVAWNGSLVFGGTNNLSLGTGVVSIGNANRDITLNESSMLSVGEVQWNSVTATRTLTVNQGTGAGAKFVLGGFQLNVNADTAARNRTILGSGNVEISGPVVNGNLFNNGLIYSGTGTLTLSAANTYSGTTTVSGGGTLFLTNGSAISSSSALTINAGTVDVHGIGATVAGALTLGAATTTVAGQTASLLSGIAGGIFTLGGNITYNSGSSGFENGQAGIAADTVLTADRTVTVNDSPNAAVDLLFSGAISGAFGLTKGNGGTLRLTGTNTFTGQSALNNGTTEIYSLGNIGIAGSLGTADKDANAGIIRFGNGANTGALSYLGAGGSTNRKVQVGSGTGAASGGGATVLSNGTGALVFNAPTFNSAVTVSATGPATARVLTLGGTNTGTNSIQGAVVNNTGAGTAGTNAVGVTKQDSGTWELAGNSTYTGPTNVNGGTLVVSGTLSGTANVSINSGTLLLGTSNRLNSAADVNLGGGTLATGGFSQGDAAHAGLGALTLTVNSALDFSTGTGSVLHFGGLGTHTAGTTLAIQNFDGNGNVGDDRLIFTGDASAFTSLYAQAEVSFNGASGYTAIQFDAGNYEIVPVPEPATTGLIGAVALCALVGWRERRRLKAAEVRVND